MPEPDIAPGRPVANDGDGGSDGAAVAAGRVPTWGMGEAALGWLVALLGGLILGSFVLQISGEKDVDDLSLGLVTVAQVGLWAGLLGVPWLVSRFKGNGMAADFGLREARRDALPDVLNGAFWGLFTQFVLIPLLYVPILLLTDIDNDDLGEVARNLTDRATDSFGVVMLVLIVGIGAPIFEEIFYRGLVLRSIEKRFGTWPAIVGSGVVFGVAHLQPLQAPALTLFGIVLAVLTVRAGRLGPAIAAHMAFNMATVIVLLN